jgi:hypothetical protein
MVKVRNDLTGQKFGRLTVLYQIDDYVFPSGQRRPWWHCVCDCENATEVNVLGNNLTNGTTKSCGCYNLEVLSQRSKKYNRYKIIDNIVYIYFNGTDEHTDINLDKWNNIAYIQELCWCKDDNGYATANVPKSLREHFGKPKIYLHQLICPSTDGYEPDHKDRNKLNNLTDNLILKTRQHNNLNKNLLKNNTSGVTGVYWNKQKQKWVSQVTVNNKTMYLGSFSQKDDAIQTRLQAEMKYFGEFAPQKYLYEQYGVCDLGDEDQ